MNALHAHVPRPLTCIWYIYICMYVCMRIIEFAGRLFQEYQQAEYSMHAPMWRPWCKGDHWLEYTSVGLQVWSHLSGSSRSEFLEYSKGLNTYLHYFGCYGPYIRSEGVSGVAIAGCECIPLAGRFVWSFGFCSCSAVQPFSLSLEYPYWFGHHENPSLQGPVRNQKPRQDSSTIFAGL